MGQKEVIEFLKLDKPKWFTVEEISNGLDVNSSSATMSCKKLRDSDMVHHKLNPNFMSRNLEGDIDRKKFLHKYKQ